MSFDRCLPVVLKHEGGYVNHPKDPGGATNRGVTQRVYDAWRKRRKLTPRSVRHIEASEVRAIYHEQYWEVCRCDDLPAGIDLVVFDFAVNSGPKRAVRHLQSAVGVKADGICGNVTLEAVENAVKQGRTREVIIAIGLSRMKFLRKLPTWDTFGKGWTRRVQEVGSEALARVSNGKRDTGAGPRRVKGTDPEPAMSARMKTIWAGIAGGASAVTTALPTIKQYWTDFGSFSNILPSSVLGALLAGVAVVLVYQAYRKLKAVQDPTTTAPSEGDM